jgi:hypothetical protein
MIAPLDMQQTTTAVNQEYKQLKHSAVGKLLKELKKRVSRWDIEVKKSKNPSSGSIVSDYGLDDRGSIPDRDRGFFFYRGSFPRR